MSDAQGRRLSAILMADIVGYTKLVEQDTEGTVDAWKAARADVIDPTIEKHAGHIIKHTGDGFLAEFSSVQNAVSCAMDTQKGLATSPLEFRIGVSLGDVVDDGDDIHGEGVNIAARIEALAEPGGVCIAGSVYDAVRNRIDVPFEDMGEHTVKHVSAPVRVYQITVENHPTSTDTTSDLSVSEKPSIAVLPFENMSGDPEQEYFSDGMTEDIITELSRFQSLFVIARNSSFAYKGQSVNVGKIGQELGVTYIVEGSIRKAGNRVRITAQLIEAASGNHIWAERYDRELEDIFAVQDEVVATIAAALPGRIEEARVAHRRQTPTGNLSAYDCILRGNDHLRNYRRHDIADARAAFERAVELDPGSARARAGVAYTYMHDCFWNDFEARVPSLEHAERAVALDRIEPEALQILGIALAKNGRPEEGVRALEQAVKIVPASADMTTTLGICLVHAGQHDRALEALQTSERLGVFRLDSSQEFIGEVYFFQHRYREAITVFEGIVDPASWIHAYLAACFAMDGDDAAATEQVEAFKLALVQEYGEQADEVSAMDNLIKDIRVYRRPEDRELMIEGYRIAGLPV